MSSQAAGGPDGCHGRKTLTRNRASGNEPRVLEESSGQKVNPKRPRVRRWLRRLGAGLLFCVLVLAVFHRPIVFEGTRYFVVRAAQQQNLDLSYDIGGSIFTTLEILNLRALPTEEGPVQRLEVGAIRLRYSLVDLVREGLPAFLQLVDVRDVFVEITPEEPLPADKEKEPQQSKFPALFPETLRLENIHVLVRGTEGDTVVEGLHFSLLPDEPGVLRVEVLAIPGVGRWEGLAAATEFRERHFVLRDFALPPLAALREVRLDLSALDEKILGAALDGDVLGASVSLRMRIEDLNAQNLFQVEAAVEKAVFQRFLEEFGVELPLAGVLERLNMELGGELDRPASWTGGVSLTVLDLAWEEQEAGPVHVAARLADGSANASLWAGIGATNAVAANVTAALPEDMGAWANGDADFEFSARVDDLGQVPAGEIPLAGRVLASGSGSYRNEILDARVEIEADALSVAVVAVEQIRADARVVQNEATLERLAVRISERNVVTASGRFRLDGEQDYQGRADVQLGDLSVFEDAAGGKSLAGEFAAWWVGEGSLRPNRHSGSAGMDLENGRYDAVTGAEVHARGSYSPEFVDIPDLRLSAAQAAAGLSLFWQAGRLAVSRLNVDLRGKPVLQGTADLPLRFQAELLPPDEPLSLSLRADQFDLRRLFDEIGIEKPPVTGRVDATVDVKGTLERPEGIVRVAAADLRTEATKDLQPAAVDLRLDLRDQRARLALEARQPPLRPLAVTGDVPFDLPAILREGRIDPQTPLDVRATLPASNLDVLARLIPAIRRIEGTASIDARVAGTISRPAASGRIQASVRALRMADPILPPLGAVELRIGLAGDRVTIERLAGSSAGGYFDVGGTIGIAPLDNPTLDIRFRAGNLLVLRSDDITARISSDVRVNGTLAASAVSGTVWVTRSRFFRNIEILPIGLPGRPAPEPPAEPPVVSFPDPPLRDWTFDVGIVTADPFRIQGNLANGRVVMDLRLLGTGLNPWLEGTVTIEELNTSLPFSRLRIENGQVYFARQNPFVPQLNIQGRSTIREYEVNVLVSGTAMAPEAVFTSNPPLPQAEVVALIATGLTTTELTNDPNALAGRAAILALQRLYRAAFQRNRPPPDDESFFSRIQFEAGATDPRTGQQSAQVGVPLSENIVLTGGVDVGGNVQGQVRYLIRFR